MRTAIRTTALAAIVGLGVVAAVTLTDGDSADATSDAKIADALAAAPAAVGAKAMIMDWPATPDGQPTMLRAGDNGWTCMPDDPTTPGDDPMCVDAQAMKWFEGWLAHTEPKVDAAGLAYMLKGGGTASNTDPFATAPKPGEAWVAAGPHLMVFPKEPLDASRYSTDPDSGGPYVMWAGTPYAHLMIPVQ